MDLMRPPTLASFYRIDTRRVLIWFLLWSVIGLFLVQTEIADASYRGFTGESWEPWVWALSAAYAYGLVAPAIMYFCCRWPLESGRRVKTFFKLLLLYVPVTAVFITLMVLFRDLTYQLILGQIWEEGRLVARYLYEFPKTLAVFFLIAYVTYTRIAQQRAESERLEAARLQGELKDARLENLRSQLQPHFLFNTLNLISSTMYKNVETADSIVARLADVLRFSLATTNEPFVTVNDEMTMITNYLEIAHLRYGDRLKVEIVVDPSSRSSMLPSMLLQPLVENAIKHGVESSQGDMALDVSCRVVDDKLTIEMINTMNSVEKQKESFGLGLSNCRQRLTYLYTDQFKLDTDLIEENRFRVFLELPNERLNIGGES